MRAVGPPLGLYVGNQASEGCWTAFRAVCWQPTCLMKAVVPLFRAVCWQPTGLLTAVGPLLGLFVGNRCMLATYTPYQGCWTAFRAVCWQPTGPMRTVGPGLAFYFRHLGNEARQILAFSKTLQVRTFALRSSQV